MYDNIDWENQTDRTSEEDLMGMCRVRAKKVLKLGTNEEWEQGDNRLNEV